MAATKFISVNDFKELRDLTKQMQSILTETNKEEDLFHDETREEFAQVLVKVEGTSHYYPSKDRFEFCGVFLLGLLVVLILLFNC